MKRADTYDTWNTLLEQLIQLPFVIQMVRAPKILLLNGSKSTSDAPEKGQSLGTPLL